MNLPKYAKGVICFLIAVVAGAIAQGLIVGAAAAWCSVVVGALATSGVVAVKNAQSPENDGGYVDVVTLVVVLILLLIVLRIFGII